MKIIVISPARVPNVENILKSSYTQFDVTFCLQMEKVSEYLFDAGPYKVIIINAEENPEAQNVIDTILEDIGKPLIIILGDHDCIDGDIVKSEDCIYQIPANFSPDQFRDPMQKVLEAKKQEEETELTLMKDIEHFVPLRLKSFYLYKSIPYDAFIMITEDRFMKCLSRNEEYNQGTIKKIKSRNVSFLYLEKDNHISFLEQSIKSMTKELERSNTNRAFSIKILISSATLIQDYVKTIGPSPVISDFIKKLTSFHSQVVHDLGSIKSIHKYFDLRRLDIAEQSIYKSLYCEFVANELSWSSESTKERLLISAILHDAFLANDDDAIVINLAEVKSPARKKDISQHMIIAGRFAEQFMQISEIDFIIKQHHLIPDSRSFPGKIAQNHVNQISALFIIINHFISEMLSNGNWPEETIKAARRIEPTYQNAAFKKVYKEFIKLFKSSYSTY